MSAEQESANADTNDSEEQFEYYPQVTQHPTTTIEGNVVDMVTGSNLDSDVEDTGSSFGVVIEDPTVEKGTAWRNSNIPEDFDTASEYNDTLRVAINGTDIDYIRGQEVTEELVEEARDTLAERVLPTDDAEWEDLDYDEHKVGGTDYKLADESDDEVEVSYNQDGEEKGVDVGGGTFQSSSVESIDADRVMVWYGGMAGQFVGRALDFNGMPFARYTDDGYLLKGLFQVPIGWRGDADIEEFDEVPTTDRSKLARSEDNGGLGRPPRVARPPVLRDDIDERIFIKIGRYNGGRMHEVTTGRSMDDYDDEDEDVDELDMVYNQSPEEVLSAEFDNPNEVYSLYHGEGWQSEPDNAQSVVDSSGDGSGSFDVEVDDDVVEHPTESEKEFANMVSEKITGHGVSPDEEIFPVNDGEEKVALEGLVAANSGQFDMETDVEAIREVIYETTSHLDPDDL